MCQLSTLKKKKDINFMEQFAGLLGFYGYSRSESYNRNVDEANQVIDEYKNLIINSLVSLIDIIKKLI